MAAVLLALGLIINLAVHGWLGAILEATALFLALAIAVNLAVYGWLGAMGPGGPPRRHTRATGWSTSLSPAPSQCWAAGVWYALSFEVRPFE